jgi:enterobacterial common antigen flippase
MTQMISETPASSMDRPSRGASSFFRRSLPMATTVGVSFGIVALQLAQGILLARLLGPQGRGEYAAAVLYSQMLLYVGLFGAIEVVCRYAANDRVDRRSLRKSAARLALVTGTATTLIAIACATVGIPMDKREMLPLAIVCSLSIIGQHVTLILSAVDRGSGDFSRYNRIRLIAAASLPLLLICWALLAETTVLSTCVLLVVATLLSTLPCFLRVKNDAGAIPAPRTKQMLREGRPYGIAMLATDFLERIDLLLVLWLTDFSTQGFYNAMIPVAYPLTVIPNTLGMYLFNAGAREGGGLGVAQFRRILASSLLLQVIMTIAFLVFVGPVVTFVYGTEFAPAVVFAMWLAPVAATKGVVQGLESYIKGRGKPMATIRIRMLSTIVMLASIAALYPFTGILAIIQGSLVGQIVCFFGLSIFVYKDAERIDRLRDSVTNNDTQTIPAPE